MATNGVHTHTTQARSRIAGYVVEHVDDETIEQIIHTIEANRVGGLSLSEVITWHGLPRVPLMTVSQKGQSGYLTYELVPIQTYRRPVKDAPNGLEYEGVRVCFEEDEYILTSPRVLAAIPRKS